MYSALHRVKDNIAWHIVCIILQFGWPVYTHVKGKFSMIRVGKATQLTRLGTPVIDTLSALVSAKSGTYPSTIRGSSQTPERTQRCICQLALISKVFRHQFNYSFLPCNLCLLALDMSV